MPGFDGTGPRGQGSLTGGGRGFCAVPLRGASYRSFGGRGRGRGFRNRYWATGLPGWARAGYGVTENLTPTEETDMLKEEAQALKQQLQDIQDRINTLEKAKESE